MSDHPTIDRERTARNGELRYSLMHYSNGLTELSIYGPDFKEIAGARCFADLEGFEEIASCLPELWIDEIAGHFRRQYIGKEVENASL